MQNKNNKSIILKESMIGLIKVAIGTVPCFGTAINEALFDIPARINQKRINDFVNQLTNLVNKLEKNKIDIDYLKSEEFYDLTRIIFESVIKIKSEEKQLALSKIYLNAIIDRSNIELDHSLLFSKFIIDLLPLQMQILVFVDKNEGRLIEIGSYKKFYDLFINDLIYVQLDIYDFKYSCKELENKVLISMGAGLDDFDDTSSIFADNDHKEATVKLTTIGKKFIEFLK